MSEQPHVHRPFKPSAFFADGRSARPVIADTVARGQLRDDAHFETGKRGEEYAETFPFEVTNEVLARGQQRFDIFCVVCHDRLGEGNGRIVQRGFTRPPNLHTDLSRGFRLRGRDLPLRDAPAGYYFNVITNGFGAMPDHAEQMPARDRWAIVAHVRVLQLSQRVRLDELAPEERELHFPKGGAP